MKMKKSYSILRARLLNKAVGAWLFENGPEPKFRGTLKQISVATAAAAATRNFVEVLNRKGSSVVEVAKALQIKHLAAHDFEREFNAPWLL